MVNTYEITIINESGAPQSYLLFAVAPQVNATAGPVYSNVFMTAPTIVSKPNGSSQTTFTITRQFYAICGTSVQDLTAGVKVSTSDYEAVTLGYTDQATGNTVPGTTEAFTTVPGASFKLPAPDPSAPSGAYSIQTDSTFVLPDPKNTFVGLGGMNMNGQVVPMATFLAAPSTVYNIYPVVKYYIATGTYTPGQIINVQAMGLTQLVDFTNTTFNSATYIHANNGKYVPVPPAKAKQFKLLRLRNERSRELGLDDAFALEADGPGSASHRRQAGPADSGDGEDDGTSPLARELQDVILKVLNAAQAKSFGGKTKPVTANGHDGEIL